MNDWEKIITHLDDMRLFADTKVYPIVSPENWGIYSDLCNFIDLVKEEILALQKEQEAKLLTFDEVKTHFLVPKKLLRNIGEYIDYANDIEPLYMECRDEDAFVCHWRTHDNISIRLDYWKDNYNKTWRCWTKKPTQQQMKELKWEYD